MAISRDNSFKDVYTVEQFISSDTTSDMDVTVYNTSMLSILDDIQYGDKNIVYDYLDELYKLCQKVTLDDIEYDRYLFRPDLLAFDLYGTTEYEFIILALNNMASAKDFDTKKVLLIKPSTLSQALSSIMNSNIENIRRNREEIGL